MAKRWLGGESGWRGDGGHYEALDTLMDDDSSLLWEAVKLPFRALGAGLRVLDLPRQALWTLAEQGSARLGSALGVRKDPVPHWSTSWEDMETGKGVLNLYDPEWVKENERAAWFAGLGLEIAGDPINLLGGPGGLNRVGQALKKGTPQGLRLAADFGDAGARRAVDLIGKTATTADEAAKLATKYSRELLGINWAQQSERGQRALVNIFGRPLVNAPKAVTAIGGVGKSLGKAFGWVGENVLRTDFFSKTLDPHIRQVQEIARESAAEVHTKLLSVQDAMSKTLTDGVTKIAKVSGRKEADILEAVTRAAEHYSRPGWHVDEWAKVAPEIQDLATKYQMYQDEFWKMATDLTGIERPKMGAKIEKMLDDLKEARGTQLQEIAERISDERNRLFGQWSPTKGRSGSKFEKAVFNLKKATANAERYAAKLTEFQEGQRWLKGGWGHKNAELVQDLQHALSRQADAAFRVQSQMAIDMLTDAAPEVLAKERDELVKITKAMTTLAKAQDDLPAYVAHSLTPSGRAAVLDAAGQLKGAGNRIWTDQWSGLMERQIAEKIRGTTDVKRALSIDEFEKVMQAGLTGATSSKIKKFAESSVPLLDWIKYKVFGGKTPTVKVGNFYDMDLVKGFTKMTDNVVHAFESQQFVGMLKSSPELVSTVNKAADGWIHIKDVSSFAAKQMGDVWVSPQLHKELRRTYANAFHPESLNRAVRAYDKLTRIFKTSVTVPESMLPRTAGALFGGVVGGLVGGDIKSAALGAAAGFGAAHLAKGTWIPGFPAYHFRNNMSDFMLMSYNGRFNPGTVVNDGLKAASRRGTINLGGTLGEVSAEYVSRMARAQGITYGEVAAFAQSRIGTFLEDSRRMGYFVDRLKRGYSPFQAGLETKRVLFDYGQLSDFERTYMKRVVPFWSWVRNIVKLTADQMIRSPAMISHQMRLSQGDVPSGDLPDWVRGRLPIALDPDKATGEERYLLGIGLPVEDMADILDVSGGFQEWVSQFAFKVNPLLKTAIGAPSVMSGQEADGFWDEIIGRQKWPSNFGNLGEMVPESLHEKWGIRLRTDKRTGEKYYTLDADYSWMLKQVLNRFYTSLVKYTDPRKPDSVRIMSYLTGADVAHVDRARERKRKIEEQKRRRINAAVRRGDIATGQYIYKTRQSTLSKADIDALR